MKIFFAIISMVFGFVLLLLICPTKVGLFYNENSDNKIKLYIKILGIKIKLLPQKERKIKHHKKADLSAQPNVSNVQPVIKNAENKIEDSVSEVNKTSGDTGQNNSNCQINQNEESCNSNKDNYDTREQINKKNGKRNNKEKKRSRESKLNYSNISVETIMNLLSYGCEVIGAIRRIIRIDKIKIYASIATPNPANTAIAFGAAAMAVNIGLPCLKDKISIRKTDIFVTSSFDKTQTDIEAGIIVSAVLFAMIITGIKFFIKFNKIYKGGAL